MTLSITTVWPGNPNPRGATWDGEGVNFALYSENAHKVELCLFDPVTWHEAQRIELREQTHMVWQGYLPEARPGLLYGYPLESRSFVLLTQTTGAIPDFS
ncbi:MAG: hypothetical protein HQL79_10495 [Magnetococcales bacterium]|nr:hypothetical protein [Magnetococcales bacterium]